MIGPLNIEELGSSLVSNKWCSVGKAPEIHGQIFLQVEQMELDLTGWHCDGD